MKRLFPFFVLIICCLCADIVLAGEWQYGYVFDAENGTWGDDIEITGLLPTAEGNVTIPASIDGHVVRGIGEHAFRDCVNIKSVVLPTSVKKIAFGAFFGCRGLQKVELPDGLEYVDDAAFSKCESLASITIPASVFFVSDVAFQGCGSLQAINVLAGNVTYRTIDGALYNKQGTELVVWPGGKTIAVIPQGVKNIGTFAFSFSPRLETVLVPSSVTNISEEAFAACGLLKQVRLTTGLKGIGDAAFACCSNLTSIVLPSSVERIGEWAFQECYALGQVGMSSGLKEISHGAFYGCSGLTVIDVPPSVENIGGIAFEDCRSLKKVVLPDGVKNIGWSAFAYCDDLSCVIIPSSIENVGCGIFGHCPNLTTIETSCRFSMADLMLSNMNGSGGCEIIRNVKVMDGTTSIADGIFAGCTNLESVILPACLERVDPLAFSKCGNIKTTQQSGRLKMSELFPDGYTEIRDTTICAGVESVCDAMCADCNSLTNVTIASGVKRIGSFAFSNCNSLRTITIPSTVVDVGDDVFVGCSSLERILIEYTAETEVVVERLGVDLSKVQVVYLGENVVDGVPWLSVPVDGGLMLSSGVAGMSVVPSSIKGTLKIPDAIGGKRIVAIGAKAFYGNRNITSVTIPETVETISDWAFAGCSALTNVVVLSRTLTVGKGVFDSCDGVRSVVLSQGALDLRLARLFQEGYKQIDTVLFAPDVTNISYGAFWGCDGLSRVKIPDHVMSIGESAFMKCLNLKSVEVPPSINWVGLCAFRGCRLNSVEMSDMAAWCDIDFCFDGPGRDSETAAIGWSPDANPLSCGARMFCRGEELRELVIPDRVKTIKYGAFYGCTNFVSVTIPPCVTNIGYFAFSACTGLKAVHITDLSAWCKIDFHGGYYDWFNDVVSNPLYYAQRLYLNGDEILELEVPNDVTSISSGAFWNCTGFRSVIVPASVTNIGSSAFRLCSSLRTVNVKTRSLMIGDDAFSCYPRSSIERVVIPWDAVLYGDEFDSEVKIVKSLNVTLRGMTRECKYDGGKKPYPVSLVSPTPEYTPDRFVCRQLPMCGPDVAHYEREVRADWFENTNEQYDVSFVVDENHQFCQLDILPRIVSVVSGSDRKTYDGLPLVCSELAIGRDGFCNDDCSVSATGMQTSVGTSKNFLQFNWKVGVNQDNYRLEVTEGDLIVEPARMSVDVVSGDSFPVLSRFDSPNCAYDGVGHTINFQGIQSTVLPASLPTFSYSLTSNGVYRSEPYCFTNACVTSLWYKISAPNYEDFVHEARVTILPREVTLMSGSARKNFDGTALRCESYTVSGDGFVGDDGVDVVYSGNQLWLGTSDNTFEYSFRPGTLGSNYKVTTSNGSLTVEAVGRIEVDAGVTAIPAEAFKNCAELTEVALSDNVTDIGSNAFSGCTKLTKVRFPSGMEVTREKLRIWGLTDAVLADYVVGDYIVVNDSLLGYVGARDVAEVEVPAGITLVDEYALSELPDLERVVLPDSVRYVGAGAFANDTYLDEMVLPDSVETIGAGAFENCSWMQTMTMGAGVRLVGDRAFAGCTKLAAATFADGLGEIGDAAFSNCWRMMSVALPVSVSNVAATAFADCSSLTGVTVPTTVAPMSAWFAPVYRQVENVTVPVGTTEVCAEMFAGCSALKTVVLPEGVTNIASGAFRDCVSIETILLPESLEAIGDEAFAGCSALKAIVLPKNVAVLGKRAFSGCVALSDVTLSRGLTAIPDGTFAGCDALDSFVVPEAVTTLGSQIVPSATTAIYYLGNAPAYAADVYAQANAALVSYVVDGTKGWDGRPTSRDLPKAWPTENARAITTWSPVRVEVTFDANEGAFVNPAAATYGCEQIVGTAYSLPPYEPVRKGYRFAGYWTAANGGTRVTSGVSVKLTKAHTLYAHWAVGQSVTVRFNATGGAVDPEERNYVSEAPFGDLPVPTRTHYDFAGWFTEASDGTSVTAASEVPLADRELFAHWTPKQYAIRFHANDGTEASTDQAFTYGATVTLEKNGFVRTGSTFAGWATSADGAAVYADGKTLEAVSAIQDGVIHLYAVWQEISRYVVDIDGVADGSYFYGQSVTATTDAEKIAGGVKLICKGWNGTGDVPASGAGHEVTFTVTQASSLRWVYLTNYWVSVGAGVAGDGGGRGATALPTCEGGSVALKDAAGTAITNELWAATGTNLTAVATADEGWQFVEWVDSETELRCGAAGVRALPVHVERPWTLKALFSKQEHAVTFDLGGHGTRSGGGALEQQVNYGEAAVAPEVKAAKDYVFEGWDADFSSVTSNMTVHALYGTTKPYVGAVVAAGCEAMGSVIGSKNVKTGAKASLKARAKSGYAFAGWLDADGNVVSQEPTFAPVAGTRDRTFVAKFIPVADDWVTLEVPAEVTNVTKSVAVPLTFAVAGGSLPTVKVTGTLPSGLKFTAKALDVKATKTVSAARYEANTIYGTPTKSGVYAVTVTATTAGKKTVSKPLKFIVRAPGETLIDVGWDADLGKVTGVGVCAAGKSLTLKATANKGSVFAGWYQDAAFTMPAEGSVDYRTASFSVADNGKDQKLFARFVPTTADQTVAAVVADSYDLNGPWMKKLDVDSLSLPSVTVKGLPTGLKFDVKTLTVAGTPTRPGTYTVTLSLKNVTVKTAKTQKFVLNVANIESPYLSGVNYARNAYVYRGGVSVEWNIGACACDGYTISGITGLPTGLKYNAKTGRIEGVPTKAGPFTAMITLKNGKRTSLATVSMTVSAIDAWAYGTFNGGSPSNQVQLTVSNAGKLSGRLSEDGQTYSLAAKAYSAYDADTESYWADVIASWSYKEGKKTVKTNEVWTISVVEGVVGGVVEADHFCAWQNVWSQKTWKDFGTSFFGKSGTVRTLAGETYSLGEGESVTLTIKPNGTVTVKGVFDTGTVNRQNKPVYYSASGSTVVCVTEDDPFAGQIFVYFPPNVAKGFGGYVWCVRVGE